LNSPWGIYVSANFTLYVVDSGNHRVQKFEISKLHAHLIIHSYLNECILDQSYGTTIAGQSSVAGSWSYLFKSPTAIIFDQYNNLYVMDSGNNRIQCWSPGSTYGVTVASAVLGNPRGMAFDPWGNLVVADMSYHRMVMFSVICRK
jgi:tripartite motif-containing protein 71